MVFRLGESLREAWRWRRPASRLVSLSSKHRSAGVDGDRFVQVRWNGSPAAEGRGSSALAGPEPEPKVAQFALLTLLHDLAILLNGSLGILRGS